MKILKSILNYIPLATFRLQNEVESSRQYNKQNQAKWAR